MSFKENMYKFRKNYKTAVLTLSAAGLVFLLVNGYINYKFDTLWFIQFGILAIDFLYILTSRVTPPTNSPAAVTTSTETNSDTTPPSAPIQS